MKKSLFSAVFFCLCSSFIFAQNIAAQKSLVNKINQEQRKEELAVKEATIAREDVLQEKNAMTNGLSPILKYPEKQAPKVEQASQNLPEAINSKTEVQEVKPEDKSEVKPEEKQNIKTNKENPDPQGVDWIALSNGKLNVKMHRRTNGISTPNLSMKFNNVYQSLFRNIPWLMGGRARVYVYQNRKNFLDHEPVASDWSGAFFSPENNRIVMYDEPDNVNKMLSQFQHELTHLFVENYFCPPNSGKPEPPVWLNEGLAVNMEDITDKA